MHRAIRRTLRNCIQGASFFLLVGLLFHSIPMVSFLFVLCFYFISGLYLFSCKDGVSFPLCPISLCFCFYVI